MTRARKTLAATTTGEHGFLKPGGSGVLLRQVSIDQKTCAPCRHYELPSLGTVDLSFAGRLGRGHVAHEAIASAEVGDELRLGGRRLGPVRLSLSAARPHVKGMEAASGNDADEGNRWSGRAVAEDRQR